MQQKRHSKPAHRSGIMELELSGNLAFGSNGIRDDDEGCRYVFKTGNTPPRLRQYDIRRASPGFLNPQDIQQCVRREVGPRRATFVPEETMKASKIYEGFIRFEERSATLYLELSVRFFDNRDLSWFWVEMAMEEKQHAGMLQHCCEAGVFASELPDKGEIQRLNSLFRQLETRLAQPKLTLDDAFDMAIELESSEINDIYSRLTAGIQGPAYIMRKKMELSLAGHFDRLQAAASQFNASRNIQARLAELLSHCSSANPGFRVS
jgi:rubrerythrin